MSDKSYWFGFRQVRLKDIHGVSHLNPGYATPCGPYASNDIAQEERENAKAWDAAVSTVFMAARKTRLEQLLRSLQAKAERCPLDIAEKGYIQLSLRFELVLSKQNRKLRRWRLQAMNTEKEPCR